jgi:CspA family cold shock protein
MWLGRGDGIIESQEIDEDIFVHSTEVEEGKLQEGQEVEFDVEDSTKGPRAVNVKIIE